MKIKINYNDFTEETVSTLEEAKISIEAAHSNGVGVDLVVEVDEEGNEIRTFGCIWSVVLEEIP